MLRYSDFRSRCFPLRPWRQTCSMQYHALILRSGIAGQKDHEPVPRIRTRLQVKPASAWPNLTPARTRRRRRLHHYRGTLDSRRDADPDTERDANVSHDDYTIHQPGDRGRQLGLLQLGRRFRLFAHRQRLLARIQHGGLHRFAAIQRDLGFVRDSSRSPRRRLHDSTRHRPLAQTNHRNIPGRDSNPDSHHHGKRD